MGPETSFPIPQPELEPDLSATEYWPAFFFDPLHPPSVQMQGLSLYAYMGASVALGTFNRTFSLYIAGADRTTYMRSDSVSIAAQLTSRETATFELFDETGTYRPSVGQEVLVYKDTYRIFAGYVIQTEERKSEGHATACFINVSCSDYGTLFDRRVVAWQSNTYLFWIPSTVVAELLRLYFPNDGIKLQTLFAGTTINPGLSDVVLLYSHVPMSQAMDEVCSHDALTWRIDRYKNLYLFDATTGYAAAPFNLTAAGTEFRAMSVRRSLSKKANKVGVRPSHREPGMWTDTFTGAAGLNWYLLYHLLPEKPRAFVDGIEKAVLISIGPPSTPDVFYCVLGLNIIYSTSTYPGSTIRIVYPSQVQPIEYATDAADIAANGQWDIVEEIRDNWEPARMQDTAAGFLARYVDPPYEVTFTTQEDGLEVGQLINVSVNYPPIPAQDMLITSLAAHEIQTKLLEYSVEASSSAWQARANYIESQRKTARALQHEQDRTTYKIVIKLAETIQGLTNPGLQAVVVPGARTAEKDGYLSEVVFHWEGGTPPPTTTVIVAIRMNGASIFPVGNNATYSPTDTGLKRHYSFASDPMLVRRGDVFTAEVLSADAAAMDGTIELLIQG